MKTNYFLAFWVVLAYLLVQIPASRAAVLHPLQTSTSASNTVAQGQSASDAYASILNEANVILKPILWERFLTEYADSALVAEAVDQAMASYTKLTRDQFSEAASQRHPEESVSLPALVVAVFLDRKIVSEMDPADPRMKAGCQRAKEGIHSLSAWQRPRGLPEDQYQRLHNKAEGVFYGMAGFCAFRKNNYTEARKFFLHSLQFDPDNVGNMSQLAMADLEMDPIDVNGFWYAAREQTLKLRQYGVNVAADAYPYGEYKYVLYHGSREGWDQIVAQAATQTAPPPGFTVKAEKDP